MFIAIMDLKDSSLQRTGIPMPRQRTSENSPAIHRWDWRTNPR